MPRQPSSGGTGRRAPSGVAAVCPPAPSPPSTLSRERYRALRARYNALLTTLYERSSLTIREIAAVAGCTDRAVQMLTRRLGCRPRYATKCRPGTSVGARPSGPLPPPLNAPAMRRVMAAFAGVARELAASPKARAASELQRATARAERRTARTQTRVLLSAARELSHLSAVFENAAAARHSLTAGPKREARRSRAAKSANAKKPRRAMWEIEHPRARELDARMEARAKARQDEATPTEEATRRAEAERRINAIAEGFRGGRPRGPRIRGL